LTQGCFVAGDVGLMRRAMALVQAIPTFPVCEIDSPEQALHVPPRCLPVLQVVPVAPVLPWGQIDARAGQLAGEAVLWATRAALRREVAALVTAPLHKEALHAAGAPYDQYPGHTELLQAEAARHLGVSVAQMPVRMMLANDELRTVLVSIHMSLREALEAVTHDRVLETLRITDASLRTVLGRRPRIAVAGVNPHAGEGGLFGREEIDILQPCLAVARQEGLDVHGPYAPDTVFMRARQRADGQRAFDVVIAMYHDQGLIPVKYLGVEQGVNVTLGLPLIRTSPDHGTAMDLAGQGVADASSMIQALRMARQMVSAAP
jgi:4-hydroxythreonine-4-phosphate dehydrogenase